MKVKEKQQYSLLQNLGYLLKRCWRVSKGLLLGGGAEQYVSPQVLKKIEEEGPDDVSAATWNQSD